MLTSKERAELRSQANGLDVTLMVGKGGVSEQVLAETEILLEAKELAQPHYRGRVFHVLGIASDKGEAMGLVERMAIDCVKDRGDCNLREFMAC